MMALGGSLIACQEDLDIRENVNVASEDGITFQCSDMVSVYNSMDNSTTRASSPKNEEEKRIKTLHVFIFNQDTKKLMKTTNYDNFQGYMKKTNGFLKIPTPPDGKSLFEGGDDVEVRIVAIANIDATEEAVDSFDEANSFYTEYSKYGKISRASREKGSDLFEIETYDDLLEWVYYPRLRIDESTGLGDIRNLPAAGMPMIGELQNVKLNKKPSTPYVVNMESLMAKVYVKVELDPDQDQTIGDLPEMTIDEIGIRNMPVAVPFVQPTGIKRNASSLTRPANYDDYINNYDVTNVQMVHPGTTEHSDMNCKPEEHEYTIKLEQPLVVNRKSDPAIVSYYTYENIQLPNYDAKGANDQDLFPDGGLIAHYPDSVTTDARKQRYKSVMAHKNRASALILKGTFTTHQNVDYQAKFSVFMGANSTDDFKVLRNHRYDNNITIYGLDYMRNSDDDVFNYDGRIDVVSDNPIYLAMVNERKIDAHASVLPVDVWLMMWEDANKQTVGDPDVDWRSEVTFSIDEPSKNKWIRIDQVVPRSVMEESGWKAGTGAREWFTTTLMSELSDKVTLTSDEHGSRSRVYFYIDENVPVRNNVSPSEYGDREVKIKVNYKRYDKKTDALVEEKDYTIDIRQRALVKVSGQRQGRTDDKENVPDTWMEYYEEYLTHNDPLDTRNETAEYYKDGLEWGPINYSLKANSGNNGKYWGSEKVYRKNIFGTAYRDYKEDCEYNEVYGCEGAIPLTAWFVNDRGGIEEITLYNSNKPESAFHYAYGRNKRKASDGSVPNTESSRNYGWYLPGIRELEAAITQHYTNFTDFQGNFYWSAAPAEESSPYNHARATMVKNISNNKAEYVESGPETWTKPAGDGWKERNKKCRVRVFYRAAED